MVSQSFSKHREQDWKGEWRRRKNEETKCDWCDGRMYDSGDNLCIGCNILREEVNCFWRSLKNYEQEYIGKPANVIDFVRQNNAQKQT